MSSQKPKSTRKKRNTQSSSVQSHDDSELNHIPTHQSQQLDELNENVPGKKNVSFQDNALQPKAQTINSGDYHNEVYSNPDIQSDSELPSPQQTNLSKSKPQRTNKTSITKNPPTKNNTTLLSLKNNNTNDDDSPFMTSDDSDADIGSFTNPSNDEHRLETLAQTISIPAVTHEQLSELPDMFYDKYYNCTTPSQRAYSDYLESYVNHCNTCDSPGCLPYHIDILRNLSLRGYINSYHRRRIWPLLLGVMKEDIDLNYARYINPDNAQYDQLNKDILRSCHHLDIHVDHSIPMVQSNRQYAGRIMHGLFSKYDANLISYCQGFHEIVVVMMAICGVPPPAAALYDAISNIGVDLTGIQPHNSRNNSDVNSINSQQSHSTTTSTLLPKPSSSSLSTKSNSYLSRKTSSGPGSSRTNDSYGSGGIFASNDRTKYRKLTHVAQRAIKNATETTLNNVKTNSNDALAFALVEKLALTSMSQALQTSLQSVQNLISIVPTIMQPFVPEFASILSQMPLIYSLSWFLTWFSHSTMAIDTISRMFDFLLAANPLICVQVSSAVLITHAPRIKAQLQLAQHERRLMGMDDDYDDVDDDNQQQHNTNKFIVNEMDMVTIIQYFQNCQLILDVDSTIQIATALWALSSQRMLHIERTLTRHIADQPNYLYFAQSTGDYYFQQTLQHSKTQQQQDQLQLYNYFNLNTSYLAQKQTYPLDLSIIGLIKLPFILMKWLKRPRIINIVSLRFALEHLLLANGLSTKQFELPPQKLTSMLGNDDLCGDSNSCENVNNNDIDANSSTQHHHSGYSISTSSNNNNSTQSNPTTKANTNIMTDIVSLCRDLNEISAMTPGLGLGNPQIQQKQQNSNSLPPMTSKNVEKCNVASILTANSPILITHSFIYYAFRPNSLALDPVPPKRNDQTDTKDTKTDSMPYHADAGGKANLAISVWQNDRGEPMRQLGSCSVTLPSISVYVKLANMPPQILQQIRDNNPYGSLLAPPTSGQTIAHEQPVNANSNQDNTTEQSSTITVSPQDNNNNNNNNDDLGLQTNPLVIAACVNLQYIMDPHEIIKPAHAQQQEDILFSLFGGRGILKNKVKYAKVREDIRTNLLLTRDNSGDDGKNTDDNFDDIDTRNEQELNVKQFDQYGNPIKTEMSTSQKQLLQEKLKQRKLLAQMNSTTGNKKKNVRWANNNQDDTNQTDETSLNEEKIDDETKLDETNLIEEAMNKTIKQTKVIPQADEDDISHSDDDIDVKVERARRREELHRQRIAARRKLIDFKLDRNRQLLTQKLHLDGLLMNRHDGASTDMNIDEVGGDTQETPQQKQPAYHRNKNTSLANIDPATLLSQAKENIKNKKHNATLPLQYPPQLSKHVQILILDGQTKLIHMNNNGVESKAVFTTPAQNNELDFYNDNDVVGQGDVEAGLPSTNLELSEPLQSSDSEDNTNQQLDLATMNAKKNKLTQDEHLHPEVVIAQNIISQDITSPTFDYTIDELVDNAIEFSVKNDPIVQAIEKEDKLKSDLFGPLTDAEILLLQSLKTTRDNGPTSNNPSNTSVKHGVGDGDDEGEVKAHDLSQDKHLQSLQLLGPDLTHADLITFNTPKSRNMTKLTLRKPDGTYTTINPQNIPYSHGLKQFIVDPIKFEQLLEDTPPTINNMPVQMFLAIRGKQQELESKYRAQLHQEQQQYAIWRVSEQQQEQERLIAQQLKSEQKKIMLLDIKQRELDLEMERLGVKLDDWENQGETIQAIQEDDEVGNDTNAKSGTISKRKRRQQKQLYMAQKKQQDALKEQYQQHILYLQQEQQRLELYQQAEINRILNVSIPIHQQLQQQHDSDKLKAGAVVSQVNNQESNQKSQQQTIYSEDSHGVQPTEDQTTTPEFEPVLPQLKIKAKLLSPAVTTAPPPPTSTPATATTPVQSTKPSAYDIMQGSGLVPLPQQSPDDKASNQNDSSVNDDHDEDDEDDQVLKALRAHMDALQPLTTNEVVNTPMPLDDNTSVTTMAIAQRLGLPPPNNTNRLAILKAKMAQKKKRDDAKREKSFLFKAVNSTFNQDLNSTRYKNIPYENTGGLFESYDLSRGPNNNDDTQLSQQDGYAESSFMGKLKSFVVDTLGSYLASPLDIFTSDSDLDNEYDMDGSYLPLSRSHGYGSDDRNGGIAMTSPYRDGPQGADNTYEQYVKSKSRTFSVYNDDDYMYNDVAIRKRIRNERKAMLFEQEQLALLKQNMPYLPTIHQQQQYKAILLNAQLLRLGYPIIQPQNQQQQESFYWGKLVQNSDPIVIKRLNQFTQKAQRLQYAADKMSDYLLLVLDTLNVTQIQPVMHDVTDENRLLYNINSSNDAQEQYLHDCEQAKVMLLQLLLELGWVLTKEDFEWLEKQRTVYAEKLQNAHDQQKQAFLTNTLNTPPGQTHNSTPHAIIPSLSTTLQVQQASQVPLFPEVRQYLVQQLSKEQRQRQLGSLVNTPGVEHYQNNINLDPNNNNIDFNTLSDAELRSLISQHHYRIKIVDVYHASSSTLPRLPRYSLEWIEYQRQVQERLLLQQKEWILRGYSENKIKRLSKIAKRKLIYGNLSTPGSQSKYDKNGDFKGLFGGDSIHNNDHKSKSARNDAKLAKKLAKMQSQQRNPTEKDNVLFSWASDDSDDDDDDQRVDVHSVDPDAGIYHPSDLRSIGDQHQLFEKSKVTNLFLQYSPLDPKLKKLRQYAPDTFQQFSIDWDKRVNAMNSYSNTVDLQLFRFKLTKEQRKQDQMIRRAEMISSTSTSATSSSDDDDDEDGKDKSNTYKYKPVIDDVTRVINHHHKMEYRRYREERRLKIIRKQYRHELRQQRREKKAALKLQTLKQAHASNNTLSVYEMLTSSTSTDYSSTSGASDSNDDGYDFRSKYSKNGKIRTAALFTTTSDSDSDDDNDENEQVSIIRKANELLTDSDGDGHGVDNDTKRSKFNYSKFVKTQQKKALERGYDDKGENDNDQDVVDPLKQQHYQREMSKLEQRQLQLLEKRYQRQATERSYILSTPLSPAIAIPTSSSIKPNQLIQDRTATTANGLRLLLQVCSYPFTLLTTSHDVRLTHDTVLPSIESYQSQQRYINHLGTTSAGGSVLRNSTTTTSIISDLNGISNIKAYNYYGKNGVHHAGNMSHHTKNRKHKPYIQIGKNTTEISSPNIDTFPNSLVDSNHQAHQKLFIPTIFDYYTHIKRISHSHSCTCPYQVDMLTTRKSILYYHKIMMLQLLTTVAVSSTISTIYRLLSYAFPRLEGRLQWWNALTITILSDLYTLSGNTSRYIPDSLSKPSTSVTRGKSNSPNLTYHVEFDPMRAQYTEQTLRPRLSIRYPLPPSLLWVPSASHFMLLNEYRVFSLWIRHAQSEIKQKRSNHTEGNNNSIVTPNNEGTVTPNMLEYTHMLAYPDQCCECPPPLLDTTSNKKVNIANELCIHQQQRLVQKQQQLDLYQKSTSSYHLLYPKDTDAIPKLPDPSSISQQYPTHPANAQPFWENLNHNQQQYQHQLKCLRQERDNEKGLTSSEVVSLLNTTNTPPLCVCETIAFQNYFLTPHEHTLVQPVTSSNTTTSGRSPQDTMTDNALVPNTNTFETAAVTPPGPTNLPSSPTHIVSHALYALLPQSRATIIWGSLGVVVSAVAIIQFFRR